LAGPTASGKTAAALAIAQALAHTQPVEIISVDSALVYRGMDIGTAKPSAVELAAVPHHLIDIRDPLNAYSAADFCKDATQLIAEIHARGHLPLLVGGTMLYFKALFEGLDDMPKADASVRAAIETEAQAQGWAAMHAELARVDAVTAARLNPADAQRIQRALEVYRISGQPMSALHTIKKNAAHANEDTLLISLEPHDRAWLHARIAQRFEAMLAGGFLDEMRALRARGDLNPDLPAMRCVGYRQAWEYWDAQEAKSLDSRLRGNDGISDAKALTELRDKGIFATRQLAKRQLTWLRSMPQRRVVACDAPDALQQVLKLVSAL
jgi:tRNA dimethylallyltransferase